MLRLLIAALLVFTFASLNRFAAAENWPQWRGPSGDLVAAEGDYPTEFSNEEGVAWKVTLPGLGTSTPTVWGDRIFITCGVDGQDTAICYDLDGNELWQQPLGPERAPRHRTASSANPSAVTDGETVVVYFKSGTVAALDVEGEVKWNVNLQERYGEDTLWWDLGTSPVLADDRVIIAVMQEGTSYLVALNLADGEVIWHTPREYECARESDQSYTTPQIAEIDGRDVVVTWGADHLTGHDVASGELVWECGGFNPENQGMWRTIASATISDGMAVVPYGRGGFLAGVRLGGSGDVTESNRVWEHAGRGIASDVSTQAIHDGRIYLVTDAAKIVCRDLKSGDEIWSHDLPRHRDPYWASPVLAGDLLYATRQDGTIFVGRISDDGFELLNENSMGETILATPVPIRGDLLIRGHEHLFRIAATDSQ